MKFPLRHPARTVLAASLALAVLGTVSHLAAGPQTSDAAETKIRLLSEALHARDLGDRDTARKYLAELLALSPNDETVKRLLAGIDKLPEKKVTVTGGVVAPDAAPVPAPPAPEVAPPAATGEADRLAREEEERLDRLLATARATVREARALAGEKHFAEALDRVDRVRASLPENNLTQDAVAELGLTRAEIIATRDRQNPPVAAAAPVAEETPPAPPAVSAAVAPVATQPAGPAKSAAVAGTSSDEVAALLRRGRFQFLAGDSVSAAQTFVRALEHEPANAEAADFLRRIGTASVDGNVDRAKTSAQMLNEVSRAWQRPGVFQEKVPEGAAPGAPSPLLAKLNAIILPSVNFSGMELSRVVNTLSAISEEFDQTGSATKGVNIVLLDQANTNPTVNLTLRNLSLKRVLDFITDAVGYQYEVQADAVVVRPGGEPSALPTAFFPVSRSTVLRMTGKAAAGRSPAGAAAGLLAGGAADAAGGPASVEGEGQGIKNFLQLAGVSFDNGSALAFDGSQLIVTQTPRNMERIRNILARYNDVRQVEIEAKFMEVQQGALEELGVQWNVGTQAARRGTGRAADFRTSGRTLEGTFNSNSNGSQGAIVRPSVPGTFNDANGDGIPQPNEVVNQPQDGLNLPISNNPPPIPGTNILGVGANPFAAITSVIGEFNVNAVVRALSQKSGTELLSAPKLTVLSGNPATITVAQELRYPQSYGQVQAQVGTGNASGGGSAGVAITAGTPQEFTTRNVGVELKVTPTVEEDDYSISLDLNPKVTEFEGFVEYGGQSIAISGSTTVTVPSGFFQPIFGVREMSTKVTIWDGATLIMGGLTREDVKKVNDKVPVLGNLPAIGRLFRSDGESSQKRNLLIFVTANLVSPGGSLKQQTVREVPAGTMFQNPTIVTPSGTLPRTPNGK
ncbi:MAG: type II secretory pathway, component PulD [Opitutae bacterium]|nr:type II secretory pathway, component PulD [Opitutae bacterium]